MTLDTRHSHWSVTFSFLFGTGELRLPPPARPLDIVLQSDPAPRFVVRTGRAVTSGHRSDDVTGKYVQADYLRYPDYGKVVNGSDYPGKSGVLINRESGREQGRHTPRTPDLVGDCRRRPIIPASDYKTGDDNVSLWSRSTRTTMIGSDSNLNTILDNMSDSSLSVQDSVTSDTGRGRKKTSSGRPRRRARSRESSADSRDGGDFKPLSKRGSSLRTSRSMSSLFQKTFSLRKKDNPFQPKTELSTEESSPGILKIFGDSITPGANYKSVLAVSTSTSRELVKEALERYDIPKKRAVHFVLCDVIGHFMNYASDQEADESKYSLTPDNALWTEACIRIIGDNERPLVLQKYWKPTEGFARRFELRRRSDLMIIEDKDTSGVNANARKMLAKTRCESHTNVNESTSDIGSRDCYTDDELPPATNGYVTRHQRPIDPDISRRAMDREGTPNDKCAERSRLKAPTTCPFLVNIHGYNTSQDTVLHPITHRCVKVGSDKKLASRHIHLTAPDILSRHCEFRLSTKSDTSSKSPSGSQSNNTRNFTFCVHLHIHQCADVKINGVPKQERTLLKNGDVITLGEYYQFVYRDPFAPPSPAQNLPQPADTETHQQTSVDSRHVVRKHPVSPPEMNHGDDQLSVTSGMTEEEKSAIQWRVHRNATYESDHSRMKLGYFLEREDELLQKIMNLTDVHTDTFRLTPAYLLSMAVEYSAAKHDQICTRTLLLKLSTKIHNSVLVRTIIT